MSLPHAILGFLSHQAMTGYDLKTLCFDGSVSHFWPADQAQIYRTLDKLQEQGFVESHLEYQEDRPNRKVYAITEAGRAEMLRWLATPQAINVYREPFLIQMFFGAVLDYDTLAGLIKQQIADHEKRIAVFEAVPLPPLDTPGLPKRFVMQRLTLELGLRTERAYIEWLELALESLERFRPASEE